MSGGKQILHTENMHVNIIDKPVPIRYDRNGVADRLKVRRDATSWDLAKNKFRDHLTAGSAIRTTKSEVIYGQFLTIGS